MHFALADGWKWLVRNEWGVGIKNNFKGEVHLWMNIVIFIQFSTNIGPGRHQRLDLVHILRYPSSFDRRYGVWDVGFCWLGSGDTKSGMPPALIPYNETDDKRNPSEA